MTTDRDFDRLARAWLATGPDEAPDRAIAAVLQAAETTPQVRRGIRRPTWRSFTMNRLPVAAGAVAILVILVGGGFLSSRPPDPTGVGVSSTPSPTAVASATNAPSAAATTPVPADLRSMWVAAPRTVPGFVASYRYRFELTGDAFRFPFDDLIQSQLAADAAIAGGNVLQLTSTTASDGCTVGDVGRYTWTMSPSGTKLTVTRIDDACAVRSSALPGDWSRVGCKNTDDACFGDLIDAGTYPSQYFTPRLAAGGSWTPQWGALTYTVPAGWANSADWPNNFTLTPSEAYALEGPDGPPEASVREIGSFRLPVAVSQDAACVGAAIPGSPTTVDGLVGYVQGLKSVVASAPTAITVDGHQGTWLDVKVAPSWTKTCPDVPGGVPVALLLKTSDQGADQHGIGIAGAERMRLIFVDVGGGQVALIEIDSSDPAKFDDLVSQAMPIVQSFQFK